MLFQIAVSLNDPFGFDVQDIRLNKISAQYALLTLCYYIDADNSLKSLIDAEHSTPDWLTEPLGFHQHDRFQGALYTEESTFTRFGVIFGAFLRRFFSSTMLIPLALFSAWTGLVVFGIWKIDQMTKVSQVNPSCRWWCPYIPLPDSISLYISLALFLILGFWLNNCYSRYWLGMQLWHNDVRTSIELIASQISTVARVGLWHKRDRERIFSHLAALPYIAKAVLRNSRDFSEVEKMLGSADFEALSAAPHSITHVFNVLMAYISSVDKKDLDTLESGEDPFSLTLVTISGSIQSLELVLASCEAHRFIPISPSITIHVQFLMFVWLVLLPLAVVKQNGPLSIIYLIPIAYSIIALFFIGKELADPYGNDPDDIPLDNICAEIKDELRQIYKDNRESLDSIVCDTGYDREMLKPSPDDSRPPLQSGPTLGHSWNRLISALPSVYVLPMILATTWCIIAVFLSWKLSFTWDAFYRNECKTWCSPIDVDESTINNIGFALFLILGFRAFDGISRYEHGSEGIYEIEKSARNLVSEFCTSVDDRFFHRADKERFVALVSQVPLVMRDAFLGIGRCEHNRVGILSDEDWEAMQRHPKPMGFLLRTIEAYVIGACKNSSGHPMTKKHRPHPVPTRLILISRMNVLRKLIVGAYGLKRFPVAMSYVNHQQLFTSLWIALLPLAMTPWTGWYTIFWAPIICYGIFSLESIAIKLADPYGTDDIDVPVDYLCKKAANAVIEAALSIDWGLERLTQANGEHHDPYVRAVIKGTEIKQEYTLPHFDDGASPESMAHRILVPFLGISERKAKPSLYAHVLRSVPWSVLLVVSVWSLLCTFISYWMRFDTNSSRWWQSRISISSNVATYLSIASM